MLNALVRRSSAKKTSSFYTPQSTGCQKRNRTSSSLITCLACRYSKQQTGSGGPQKAWRCYSTAEGCDSETSWAEQEVDGEHFGRGSRRRDGHGRIGILIGPVDDRHSPSRR